MNKMKTTLILNSECMGSGSDDLGKKLIGSFLRKIWASENKPSDIVFYNSGVKLIATGSSTLDVLDALEASGVNLVACRTCVEYYSLNDTILIGNVGSMEDILEIIIKSDKIITI